jgi:hypothetical protein
LSWENIVIIIVLECYYKFDTTYCTRKFISQNNIAFYTNPFNLISRFTLELLQLPALTMNMTATIFAQSMTIVTLTGAHRAIGHPSTGSLLSLYGIQVVIMRDIDARGRGLTCSPCQRVPPGHVRSHAILRTRPAEHTAVGAMPDKRLLT